MSSLPKNLEEKLQKRERENALRTLQQPQNLVDFSSNDYLGFSRIMEIEERAKEYLQNFGLNQNGPSGSRLLTGNHPLYPELEALLSTYHKAEAALVFNSGYDANIGFFSCVPQRGDLVFFDELVHASIRDGIKMGNAKSYKFGHNDLEDLKKKVKRALHNSSKSTESEIYIVTESVFSMDGDTPNLQQLADFCADNSYHLTVDEAHAIGIFGEGKGLIGQLGLEKHVFARIITFGKALGVHGAAILGSPRLVTYLVNFARSLIYTTGLPPHTIAMVLSAYRYLQDVGSKNQKELLESIEFFKKQVKEHNFEDRFIPSDSAIHCMVYPGNDKVKELSRYLTGKGFDVKPILSPTVKQGKERLRFCLHKYNTHDEILEVLTHIKEYVTP
ncbi:aminotransferase class I/II-fold pyridoxal phosphate-dependent enzyme [Flagellimonas allohymeniacidonis]|uniref:Aminotransferase class I/II-fold pyridoxal phosphate-dependent enzyme n=1 Tax=Flagellimonas allohymeniacidonis TaxID=2517819 RepID=A0A4Q8QGY1_9FLAO|nr:aminotransferase class I/II-fold pyridoxal phosphate-dependent enzyme [Allomuricauda hymeniacidonis]TAI47863.1 aminotransferase class I/II-fold pyridoxal phosphate-dependent enzyme [Allomuricauda hymeniacidonis]